MNQMPASLDSTLLTIVLAVLAVGLPILTILAIRFFWDRSLYLGRSKELEKLIWQLHRIASAMEHQLNVSFPAVQPGTEEAADLAFLERPAASQPRPMQAAAPTPAPAPTPRAAAPVAAIPRPSAVTPVAAAPPAPVAQPPAPAATPQLEVAPPPPATAQAQEPTAEQAADPSAFPPLVPRDPKDPPRHGGVNSMFGF